MNVTHDQLISWAKAPSETEETKAQNTIARITNILKSRFGSQIDVYLQGSYKNRTNVKQESDVDIVVEYLLAHYPNLDFLSTEQKQVYYQYVHNPHEYNVNQFKVDVYKALMVEFDVGEVESKEKCIKVNKNSYRVNADVIPCFGHKRLATPYETQVEGIHFFTDNGLEIFSFPKQHHENGEFKNIQTDGKYKKVVRILKRFRDLLVEERGLDNDQISSFLIECLVWNVDKSFFQSNNYIELTKSIIQAIWNDMRDFNKYNNYAEVSDLMYLFRGQKSRHPQQSEYFMVQSWNFL